MSGGDDGDTGSGGGAQPPRPERLGWLGDEPDADDEGASPPGGDEDRLAALAASDVAGSSLAADATPTDEPHGDDGDDADDDDDELIEVVVDVLARERVAPHPSRPAGLEGFDLAAVPTADIQAELDRRDREATALRLEKSRLHSRLAQIDRELARLTGIEDEAPRLTSLPTPARNDLSDMPLADAIAKLFSIGDEFSPADAEQRLVDAGYSSRAASLRTAVNQVLSKELRFKRMARGLYLRTG